MKTLLILSAVILAAQAISVREEWAQFKLTHDKNYADLKGENFHFLTYQENKAKIAAHNEKYGKGEVTYYKSVNQFTDLSFEQFKEQMGIREVLPKYENVTLYTKKVGDIPGQFNWRDRSGVTAVKDQGQCGSCWAFSTICSLESRYFIVHSQTLIDMSEQQLVDCTNNNIYGNHGCNGGWPTGAYNYIFNNDINPTRTYPYVAKDQNCRADGGQNLHVKLTGILQSNPDDEETLRHCVYEQGVMAVAIDVTDNFQHYGGGVFDDPTCNKNTFNHGVSVVGYGRQDNKDYWAVKNSWGSGWGEDGYIKMVRKKNGQCGIAQYAYSPILGN